MEVAVRLLSPPSPAFFSNAIRGYNPKVPNASNLKFLSPSHSKTRDCGRKKCMVSSALPETAASVVITAIAVGAAATLLVKRTKDSEVLDSSLKTCEDCGGSGICAECNGEGFVLKKLTEGSADKARMNAKNMATRYTAGLPKKWSYCLKCSSARSCSKCDGRGKVRSCCCCFW